MKGTTVSGDMRGRIRCVGIILLLMCLFALPTSAFAIVPSTDYYVKTPANGGNDANNGQSWDQAKATITAAMGIARAYDIIHVAAGTYNERVVFGAYHGIKLLGGYPAAASVGAIQAPWDNPTILDGTGLGSGSLIRIDADFGANRGYADLMIDGFTIQNGSKTTAYAAGIQSFSPGLTVKRCIIQNNTSSSTGWAGGIYVAALLNEYTTRVFRLQECIIRNNSGPGAGALIVDSIGSASVEITNCLITGNQSTATGAPWSIAGCGGMIIGTGAQFVNYAKVTNCTIADNTSAHSTKPVGGILVNLDNWAGQVSLTNNIIWHATLDDIYSYLYAGNVTLSYSDLQDSGDTGTGVIHTDPAFVGGGDYHLTSGSGSCLNGGTNTGAPSTDLEGTSRPQGAGYDMGAYEFVVIPEPDITVTDTAAPTDDQTVPFGNMTVGDSDTATVTVTNDGDADLTLGAIANDSVAAPFSITQNDCSGATLGAGESCTITVEFAPTQVGSFTDSFDIPSDDPDENPVTVDISGTGTPIPEPDITVTDSQAPADDQQIPFGTVTEGQTVQATVTVANDGDADLTLGAIANDSVAAPFSIIQNDCSGATLGAGDSCTITLEFAPTQVGSFTDSFDIPSDDPDENPVTVDLSGTGAAAVVPTTQYTLTVQVVGSGAVDPAGGGTYDANTVVPLTATPASGWLFQSWSGDVADADSATTSVTMNADKTVTAMFVEDSDDDGVGTIEEQGPAGNDPTYDGNDDGTPDAQQENVASMHTNDNQAYVTLASPAGTTMTGVAAADNPSPNDAPASSQFQYGFFDFTVNGVGVGGSTTVTLYLPADASVNTYYKYGRTPDNTTDHWYEFLYDAQTGTGAEINGNVITLHFVDGLRGDDDLTENGTIVDIGAPGDAAVPATRSSSSDCFISTADSTRPHGRLGIPFGIAAVALGLLFTLRRRAD